MITKVFGKKYAQLCLKIFILLIVIYLILMILHSMSCSKSVEEFVETNDSIPARIKIGLPDKDGRVQFFASFDSKDLLRLWNNRPKILPPPTPATLKAPSVNYNLYNDSICKNKNVEFIAYVLTSVDEFSRRTILRETWADTNLLKLDFLKVIFVVGTTSDLALQEKLVKEFNKYHDIVQGDFLDNNKAKSQKALLAMKWISEFCSHAKYTLKTNSATFVNIFGMLALIENNIMTNDTIMCPLWGDDQMPILRESSKCADWCVRDDEFPGMTHFPQYCAGVGYLSTTSLLKELYEASSRSVFFWIEDVYVTGVLTKNLDRPVDFVNMHSRFSLNEETLKLEYLEGRTAIHVFLTEVTNEKLFRNMWKSLINKLPQKWLSKLSNSTLERNS